MEDLKLFGGTSDPLLVRDIAKHLKTNISAIDIMRFPDGEIGVKIKENVRGRDVFVVQSMCSPVNENLMELLIMIDAFRRASARRITAVIPYFGYARQDRKDQPRVPITAKLVANLIVNSGASRVLTLDLHAGQVQGFFDIPLDHLYAINDFVAFLRKMKLKNITVVSPDVGGVKRARSYAKRLECGLAVIDKRRESPTSTEVINILGDVKGKNCIMVDDIIATGSSLVGAARALKKAGAKKIIACITHAVLCGNALENISKSDLDILAVTDSIPLSSEKRHPKIKVVSVAKLFSEAIKRIHWEKSISVLFGDIKD